MLEREQMQPLNHLRPEGWWDSHAASTITPTCKLANSGILFFDKFFNFQLSEASGPFQKDTAKTKLLGACGSNMSFSDGRGLEF